MHKGLIKAGEQFNGLQELYRRKDGAKCLLQFINDFDFSNFSNDIVTPEERGRIAVRLAMAELFLSDEGFLKNANLSIQKEIASVALKNIIEESQLPSVFGAIGLESSSLLLCVSLKTVNKELKSQTLNDFMTDKIIFDKFVVKELITYYFSTLNQ